MLCSMPCDWKSVLYGLLLVIPVTPAPNLDSDTCSLLPSELGPDWYKVPQPVHEEFQNIPVYERSFIHMPCAATTVFDVSVCGCTNLMAFIYTSLRKGQLTGEERAVKKVSPKDFVKLIDDSTEKPPVGSLLINTKTGEVKHCPFRASPQGAQWYMTREPRDNWISMKCAKGTVFDKRQCTCVHRLLKLREPLEVDEENILILEDEFTRAKSDDVISQSLGISLSDIDFSPRRTDDEADIPFWRRQDLFEPKDSKAESKKFKGKSDVTVTLHNHKVEDVHKDDSVEIGKDTISDVHKKMFLKSRKEPVSIAKQKPLPLVLDRSLHIKTDFNNRLHADDTSGSLIIEIPHVDNNNSQRNVVPKGTATLKTDITISTSTPTIISTRVNKKANDMVRVEINDTEGNKGQDTEIVFDKAECRKRPLAELGRQFFLMFVPDLGYVPFSCHGHSVYDDNTCTCSPSPGPTKFDEMPFPEKGCTRRPLTELGPQYFEDYLHDFGLIPFACHGATVFNELKCTCE